MERLTKVMDKYLSEAKKKVLTLAVSKEWFDMIVSGEKNEEYRVIKDFWMSRLLLIKDEEFKDFDKYDKLHIGKTFEMLIDINTIKEKLNNGTMKFVPFTHVLFKNGYYDDSPKVEKEIESITIGKPKKGLCPDKWLDTEFFVIKFKYRMTNEEFFNAHMGERVLYKGKDIGAYVAGYVEEKYIILGFDDYTGCILCFTSKVKNLCDIYHSYRFAKLKYLEVIKHQ